MTGLKFFYKALQTVEHLFYRKCNDMINFDLTFHHGHNQFPFCENTRNTASSILSFIFKWIQGLNDLFQLELLLELHWNFL